MPINVGKFWTALEGQLQPYTTLLPKNILSSSVSCVYFIFFSPKNYVGHALYTWPIIILFHEVSEEVIPDHL